MYFPRFPKVFKPSFLSNFMFGFLKDKLKQATKIFSKKVEEEAKEEKIEKEELEKIEEKKEAVREGGKRKEKKGKSKSLLKKKAREKIKEKEFEEEPEEELIAPEPEEIKEAGKGFFARLKEKVTTKKIDNEQFEEFFSEMEFALMESNVALEVIEKIKEELKIDLVNVPLRKGKIEEVIQESLENTIKDILEESEFDLIKEVKAKKDKPYVILFVGVNGSGKTTSIAKIAYMLKQNKLNCVLAAADTFRAASIEQLEEHAGKIGVKVVKHQYGGDPGAVVYDAIAHAKAKNIDCVLVDTAGRQQSNEDLMNEMKKINRIAKADLKLFVGEAVTGNDCLEQVREFNKVVEIDGIVLSKLDSDEKGGAALSVSYVVKKPILFVGVGQKYKDLEKFSKEKILRNLGI